MRNAEIGNKVFLFIVVVYKAFFSRRPVLETVIASCEYSRNPVLYGKGTVGTRTQTMSDC